MIYLSQLLGNPIIDASGEVLGKVSDLGIATGEVFPRVTSLAFIGPGKTPFMISWRKYVDSFDENEIRLKVTATDVRFSYLQPEEVLIARDILNKQIVDTRGMRVVRVNDLKLSDTSSSQLRLLGAEVGVRGLLRSISPRLETIVCNAAQTLGKPIPENIITWSYMDLVERDLSNVKLSVSHKTLDDMHPADVADIIEQLDPRLRGQVFAQLDAEQQAEAVAELDDDEMAAELVEGLEDRAASQILSAMDPDDAAELVSELDYEKAEKLLRLMGVNEQRAVRQLLGYRDNTAGRIMTSEFLAVPETATAEDAIQALQDLEEGFESVRYIYLIDEKGLLSGVVSLNQLIVADLREPLANIATPRADVIVANPEDDQEDVAEDISKYNLLAMPVVDDAGKLVGIVTVDDALEVMREEHEEDLQIAGSGVGSSGEGDVSLFVRILAREMWVFFWMLGVLLLSIVSGTPQINVGLVMAAALPIALSASDMMVRHVINFVLEYDEDDEDAPSVLGFSLRAIFTSVVYAALVILVARGVEAVIWQQFVAVDYAPYTQLAAFVQGVTLAAAIVPVMFVLSPVFLVALRYREASGVDTSGAAVRAIAIAIALVIFVLVARFVLIPGLVA